MASHAPQTVGFITNNGSVMTDGYSARLGRGQFGIIDKGAAPSALGQKVTSTIATSPKDRLFQLAVGAPDLNPSKFQSNQAWRSRPFKLSEVVDISVTAPKLGITVDKWILGYNGVDGTEIVLQNGDNEVIDITLEGEAIGMLGYEDSKVRVQLHLTAPNKGAFTMHEIVEKGVQQLKEVKLKGGIPITEYVDIQPVNSENPVTVAGADYTFYNLTITDEGRLSDLGLVQAQYPLHKVVQSNYSDGKSTYTIVAPTGTVLANFTQTSVSAIDTDCDGEPNTTTSSVSTAWTEGSTCRAIVEDYTIQVADNECGQNRLADLQAYYPELNILVDTPQQTQTVTLTGTSGTGNVIIDGTNYLATFNTNLTTTATNFDTLHSTALTALGITVSASGAVLTFTANAGSFPVISFDNLTGNLGATVGAIAGSGTANEFLCQTVYRTRVFTNIVCEECDPTLRDLFVSQKPESFEFVDWAAEPKVYSETAKMGIYFEGKESIFSATEEFRGEIPYIYSSTRISVANIAPGFVNHSYNAGTNGRFALKLKSRATEPSGLGKDLWDLEERSRVYFTGAQRHEGNNYAKWVLGEESLLKPLKHYVMYSVRVRPTKFAQSFSGELVENFNYLIVAEVGKHSNVETYINALATAAGLPTVSAY